MARKQKINWPIAWAFVVGSLIVTGITMAYGFIMEKVNQ
tara:strand:- start:299 stop:415 length:117 start_codon:yes stop_codon:yes gene_type:complete